MPLTEQKRRYAEARMAGASKKDAAISAGCPKKTASQAASRYEKDPDVLAAIGRTQVVKAAIKHEPPTGAPNPYIPSKSSNPLKFFESVMNDLEADPKLRLEAAKALAGFTIAKAGEEGKKEQRQSKAEKTASQSRFAPRSGPRLAVDNG